MRVAYTPTIREHFRAIGELRRVARVYDSVGALPYLLAALLLGGVVTHVTFQAGPLRVEDLLWLSSPPIFFLLGIGIRVREGLGREVSFDFGADAIEVRQPRLRWSVAWAHVGRVEETEEFFLVAAARTAFYIPRRALDDDAASRLRAVLAARGAAP